MPGIDLRDSPCVVVLFVLSSLSAGAALLVGLDALALVDVHARRVRLARVDAALIIAELSVLVVLMVSVEVSGKDGASAVLHLMTGDVAWIFWVFLVLFRPGCSGAFAWAGGAGA